MMLPKINQKRIISLLKEGKRIDRRSNFDFRDIKIETGISNNAEGTARVKIGKTEVIVGVKMGTQEPYTDHEDEGTMVTGMEFSPICHSRYEPGPPKMNAIETSRVVDRGIRESGFIDWKKLCIVEGEKVWSIYIDIYCINDDGNALDASALAAVAALRVTKFPELDKNNNVKYGSFTDNPLPLNEHTPFTMTFHKIGESLLIDPTRDEEDASEGRLTLAITQPDKDYIINSMQKGEITPISGDELNTIISESEKAFKAIFPDIEKKINSLK
jgi:exosome complex component RRP42